MASPFTSNDECSIPLVIVQGFLGVFSWEYHISKHHHHIPLERRKILIASLGPVSSLHDRACELFYSLAGGTVDYGAEHNATFRDGLYPNWSMNRPLHFIGHSIGGPTIIKMPHLLQQSHFGKDGHPNMVLSVNAGAQLVYTLGESTTAAPSVRPFSVGSVLAKLVHVLAYLSPILPSALDVHADARSLSYHESSVASFVKHLWRSNWAESKDAAPYDMTFEAANDRETYMEGRVYSNTFYRSHVSRMTRKLNADASDYRHHPRYLYSFTHNLLYLMSISIGAFDYSLLVPPLSSSDSQNTRCKLGNMPSEGQIGQGRIDTQVEGEEYWAYDGIVPVFSQWHPLPCRMTKCDHRKSMGYQAFQRSPNDRHFYYGPLQPASWTVIMADDSNHLSLIPGPFRDNIYQEAFWIELRSWLEMVDASVIQRHIF